MARILIVDDDVDILKVVEKVLQISNHITYTARDATSAMDLLNVSQFDILITDANMPGFSGFELTQLIKNNKRLDKMAICMLTGLREKKDIEKAIRSGVDEYIVKPIDPAVFLQKIENILIKKPPHNVEEYCLDENSKQANASFQIQCRLIKLTELGIEVISPTELPLGTTPSLQVDLFREMGLKNPPALKVISSRKTNSGQFNIHLAFHVYNHLFQEQVRKWIIQSKSSKERKPA